MWKSLKRKIFDWQLYFSNARRSKEGEMFLTPQRTSDRSLRAQTRTLSPSVSGSSLSFCHRCSINIKIQKIFKANYYRVWNSPWSVTKKSSSSVWINRYIYINYMYLYITYPFKWCRDFSWCHAKNNSVQCRNALVTVQESLAHRGCLASHKAQVLQAPEMPFF